MTTHSKSGITKPRQPLSLLTQTVSTLPSSHIKALEDPNWHGAMNAEYDAQIKKRTWSLVPHPKSVNIVRSMWLFRHKHDEDGNLTSYKACLVANGKCQDVGFDYDDTFSLVFKPAMIRMVLYFALSHN
ncbi:PREDICTED: uncharacterized protein LOC109130955 [Camelina sativa]|uniref:Uncharacterized protein LOC109130955 n=1 Tax=Camelina sativa TaxID=90675 RepID=A0ABM1RCD9_CAMSA|nr:PREDICTED: uncharacterized protein LOC109130955 [Camelina sativa]